MRVFLKYAITVCNLQFAYCMLQAVAQTKDAGLWTSFAIEKKITQSLEVSLAEELRFNENISELGTFFTDAGVTYRLNNDFRISANYRFINKRQVEDYYSIRHRYYFDLNYRKKMNKLTPALRVRMQSQYSDIFSSDDGKIPEWYLRPKISLRYNMKGPWNPYVSSEFFYHFAEKEFDNVRYTVGAERNISAKLQAGISFIHQREFNVSNAVYDYIWVVGLTYSL